MRISKNTNRYISVLLLVALACTGDSGTHPSPGNPGLALGRVIVSPLVTIMAVGATQPLAPRVESMSGDVLAEVDSIRYHLDRVTDSAYVSVDKVTGLVRAHAVTPSTSPAINVLVYKGGGIKGDQAIVKVTATALVNPVLSIQPIAPDTASAEIGMQKTIIPRLWSATTGDSVVSPAVRYTARSEDRLRVNVFRPRIVTPPPQLFVVQANDMRPSISRSNQIAPTEAEGGAWIYAEINAYGTQLRDSVFITFSYNHRGFIALEKRMLAVQSGAANQTYVFAAPATLSFSMFNSTDDGPSRDSLVKVSFTFDRPDVALEDSPPSSLGGTVGNITPIGLGFGSATRRFETPGTYRWTATVIGPAPLGGQTLTGQFTIR